MVEKILSQDEMDALLHGVQSGQVDTRTAPVPTSGVRPYDLMNLNHYVTLHPTMAIKVVSDLFRVPFQLALKRAFRKEVKLEQTAVEMNKFDSFLEVIPPMSSFNLLKLEPLTNSVLLVITADLVYLLLVYFYGGGKVQTRQGEEYTLIETRFIRKIVDLLMVELQKAWESISPVKITVQRTDCTSRTMKIFPDKDWVVTARFRLTIDESGEDFYLCFPFSHLEPLRKTLYGGPANAAVRKSGQGEAALKYHLAESGWVTVSATVGCTALTVPEIIKLEVGDVIALDRKVNEDLELSVENYPIFYGRPGTYKDKQAFQIQSVIPQKQ